MNAWTNNRDAENTNLDKHSGPEEYRQVKTDRPQDAASMKLFNQFVNGRRCLQILLIVSFIAFSWLAFMVVHEFGHALTAWLTGGSVALMVLHPQQISWTTFSSNPHPQLTAWGGALGGSVFPVVFLLIARRLRSPGLYLFRFFAGFCLIANGLYLFVDSFGRGGDGHTLIQYGASQWELLLFGIVATPLGFWLWHGLGPHFGLGAARGRVSGSAAVISVSLLAATVAIELLLYPFPKQ